MGHLLGVVGTLLLYLSFFAYFLGDMLTSFLPKNIATMVMEHRLSVLIVAIILMMWSISEHFKKKKQAKLTQDIEPRYADVNRATIVQDDPSVFQVDRQKLAQQRQTDQRLMGIAAETSWEPLVSGGANFKTVHLKQVSPARLEVVRASYFFYVIGLVFLLGMLMLHEVRDEGMQMNMETLFPLFFALVFMGIGFVLMYYPRPRVFDKTLGWFWLGKSKLNQSADIRALKKRCELSEITALQLISERVSGENSSYKSYELNVVLNDGSRLNVMDHGDKVSIIADANMLADFLGVPILQ